MLLTRSLFFSLCGRTNQIKDSGKTTMYLRCEYSCILRRVVGRVGRNWRVKASPACLLLLVQKMARSLSLYSACIPRGLLRRVLVTGAAPFLLDSRGVRSRQCDDYTGRVCPLRAAASTEPWLLAARSPPLAGRAPAWPTTYRELSRLGCLATMIRCLREPRQ